MPFGRWSLSSCGGRIQQDSNAATCRASLLNFDCGYWGKLLADDFIFHNHVPFNATPKAAGGGGAMKRILSVIFSAIFGLTSCTTFLPDHIATVNVDAITFAVLTELYCAAKDLPDREHPPYFASDDYWVAAIDMYLSASIEASANPAVSLLGPFNLAKAVPVGGTTGSFTSVFSGSVDETRTNMREYKIYVYLKRLVYGNQTVPDWKTFAERNRWPVHCEDPNAGGTYLQGRLGLEDWLAPAVRTQEASVGYAPLNAPPAPPVTPPPPPPTITDVYPKTGTKKGGELITITGANLASVTQVIFGKLSPITKLCDKTSTAATGPCFSYTPSKLEVIAPESSAAGTVDVTVRGPTGDATSASAFTFIEEPTIAFLNKSGKTVDKSLTATAAPSPPSSGAQQSPTISGTFTFTIKSTGTIGPSFTLTRVSGGGSNLFTATRTDNSYVVIGLTAAYYCPVSPSVPAPGTCAANQTTTAREPNADQLNNAIIRLDNAILNQNLAKIAPQ